MNDSAEERGCPACGAAGESGAAGSASGGLAWVGSGPGASASEGPPLVEEEAKALSRLADREALVRRLRRIEGQVRGLQRMVEEGRYCPDILVQIAAVKAAIDQVALSLMEWHTRGCVHDAISGGRGQEAIDELIDVFRVFLR